MPYGPPGRPPEPPKQGSGVLRALMSILLIVVVGIGYWAVKVGPKKAMDTFAGPDHSYDEGGTATGPALTGDNPLLTSDTTLLPASCDYAPWGTDVSTAKAFFSAAADCLEDAWRPAVEQAGLEFGTPTVEVTADTAGISTPCTGTTADFAAFYCPANQTIYMPISKLQTEMFGDDWVVYLSVFAHEYGHHVQLVSGILQKANTARIEVGVRSDEGLETSRRIELQANCFDGMYIGASADGRALQSDQVESATTDAYGRGDHAGSARDHGSPDNSGQWFERGTEDSRADSCNTWTARDGAVS